MRRSARRILVTGFGPFPGMPTNPTQALVEALASAPPPAVDLEVLDTRWEVAAGVVTRARRAGAVIMFGVAGSAWRIRYERMASAHIADRADAANTSPSGPAPFRSRWTRFNVTELASRARAAGFPVVPSHSAGTYVCNASYGVALACKPRTLFVHVPPLTARGPLSAAGLVAHARWLIGAIAADLAHATR